MSAELRTSWRAYFRNCGQVAAASDAAGWAAARAGRGMNWTPAPLPPFPDELRGLACGARTRAGGACKRTDLGRSGRCKLHGGFSTGPRTAEGIAQARANLALRWRSEAHEAASFVNRPDASEAHERTGNDTFTGSEPLGDLTKLEAGGSAILARGSG